MKVLSPLGEGVIPHPAGEGVGHSLFTTANIGKFFIFINMAHLLDPNLPENSKSLCIKKLHSSKVQAVSSNMDLYLITKHFISIQVLN